MKKLATLLVAVGALMLAFIAVAPNSAEAGWRRWGGGWGPGVGVYVGPGYGYGYGPRAYRPYRYSYGYGYPYAAYPYWRTGRYWRRGWY